MDKSNLFGKPCKLWFSRSKELSVQDIGKAITFEIKTKKLSDNEHLSNIFQSLAEEIIFFIRSKNKSIRDEFVRSVKNASNYNLTLMF